MLTAHQVAELRAGVQAAQRKPWTGPFGYATCADGPLAGLRVRLEPAVASSPQAIIGWCQPTNRGPVVAYYVQSGRIGEWRFQGFDEPGR